MSDQLKTIMIDWVLYPEAADRTNLTVDRHIYWVSSMLCIEKSLLFKFSYAFAVRAIDSVGQDFENPE